jgi:hypothetical protein
MQLVRKKVYQEAAAFFRCKGDSSEEMAWEQVRSAGTNGLGKRSDRALKHP